MKIKQIREKTDSALAALLAEKRKDLYEFRVGFAGGKNRKVGTAKVLRREVAQILTILRERKGAPRTAEESAA